MQNKKKKILPSPLQDRVLVSRKKPESVSAGGIIIPETAFKSQNEGFVVAVGPTVGLTIVSLANRSSDYPKVGDHILFGEYAGNEVTYQGEDYLLMKEADVLCILPD